MPVEVSGAAPEMLEPLEAEAQDGPVEDAPDPALLNELGLEVASTQKEGESAQEATEDAVEQVAEETEAAAEDKEEEAEAKEEEPKGRADKRIRGLVSEKKALEERINHQQAEFQRQVQYLQQQQQRQYQEQFNAMQQQNALLQKQLDLLSRRSTDEEEKNLTPMEQYERKILREAEARAEAKLSPRIQQMERMLVQERQLREQSAQKAQQQKKLQEFTAKAQEAAQSHLMSDVDKGVFAPEDASVASDLVLAYVAATGVEPKVAAQRFKGFLDKYHQGRMRKVSNTSGKKIQASQKVPAPMQPKGSSVKTQGMPSLAELKQGGFDNHVQWMKAGEPQLRKRT